MGIPRHPLAFLPRIWADNATLRELPCDDPTLAPSHATWIENVNAWIASNEEDLKEIRHFVGPDARVLLPHQLPIPDVHFGTDEQMLAWCAREGIVPVKDRRGHWDWDRAWEEYEARQEKEADDRQ
jgi:hypothetical protein